MEQPEPVDQRDRLDNLVAGDHLGRLDQEDFEVVRVVEDRQDLVDHVDDQEIADHRDDRVHEVRIISVHRCTSHGIRGLQPPHADKAIIFRAKADFFGQKPAAKNKKYVYFCIY